MKIYLAHFFAAAAEACNYLSMSLYGHCNKGQSHYKGSPFRMLCMEFIGMDEVIREKCHKEVILWSFSYNSFIKSHGEKIGSHNMTVICPNLCYN